MTHEPRCSVVLPTYNRIETLPRAVASVLAQDEPDFELLIVDDASTDATGTWLSTLSDPRIRTIRLERNAGPSAARNRGLEVARAPFVAFLDSDDVYLAKRLSVPLRAFAGEHDVVCALSSSIKQIRTRQRLALLPDLKLASTVFEWALFYDLIGVETTSITVRTDSARAAGGFCEALRHTEDREFLIRVARLGAARILPDVLWKKSWLDDSLSNDWIAAGRDLVRYVAQRPEYVRQYRKVGTYLAGKLLVASLRRRDLATLIDDWRRFRAAGLLTRDLARLVRDYREVRRYRRAMSNRDALLSLTSPPLASAAPEGPARQSDALSSVTSPPLAPAAPQERRVEP
jgi:glycosyltransferase involved in cell wall biosynthesis